MKIIFADQAFELHSSGILFWPERSLVIVSDLHLEKGSHFARHGFFLPPYDSRDTLERLHAVLTFYRAKKLIILGDTFHDEGGYHRLCPLSSDLLKELLLYDPVWIIGNHDGNFVPTGFEAHKSYKVENITFNHEADINLSHEISGHFHPKIELKHKDAVISRKCFIEDGNRLILPAFGAYTGGLSTSHPVFSSILNRPRIYTLGDKIYAVKN